MMRKITALVLGLMIGIFSIGSLQSAARVSDPCAPYNLMPETSDYDDIVLAILSDLAEAESLDAASYWSLNVAPLFVAAEKDGVEREVLLGIAAGIKENLVLGMIIASELTDVLQEELRALVIGGDAAVVHMPPLPKHMVTYLRAATFLSQAEQASIAFEFHDQLEASGNPYVVFDLLKERVMLLDRKGGKRSVAIDPRIHGLMRLDVGAGDGVPHVMLESLPKTKATKAQIEALNAQRKELDNLGSSELTINDIPLPIEKYNVGDGAVCVICASAEELYKNPCACCAADTLFCGACLVGVALKFIKELKFDRDGDLGPAHLVFAVQIPSCSICRTPYFNESNIAALESTLPVGRRKKIIVDCLAELLIEEMVGLNNCAIENFLGRVRATYTPFTDVITHQHESTRRLSAHLIAMQLADRHPVMNLAFATPFSDSCVWQGANYHK